MLVVNSSNHVVKKSKLRLASSKSVITSGTYTGFSADFELEVAIGMLDAAFVPTALEAFDGAFEIIDVAAVDDRTFVAEEARVWVFPTITLAKKRKK